MDPEALDHIDPQRRALYANLDRPDDPALILENAEKVADARKPEPVLEYLHARALAPSSPREIWIRQAMVASSMEYLLEDFFSGRSPWRLRDMFDAASVLRAAEAMRSPRGVLALTFHGGFLGLVRHFPAEFVDGSLVIDAETRPKYRSVGANNPGAALLAALHALQEGRSVCIAPDGSAGRRAASIRVLGADCPVADGAAFLAHETGCDTVWYAIRREGRAFVPVVEPGPSRTRGETLPEFRARLMAFYSGKIAEHFTGDPQNLVLLNGWSRRFFHAMMDPTDLRNLSPKKRARYAVLDHPSDPERIFENAEKLAHTLRPDPVLGYLYARARPPRPNWEAWVTEARLALSLHTVMFDFFYRNGEPLNRLLDQDACVAAARALTSPRGLVALTFHGGFESLLRHVFSRFVDQSVIIEGKTLSKSRTLGANNPGAALFGALRVLGEGRTVYLAPEGPLGKPTGQIEVLGARCSVTDGAAFLAHQSGCDTAWYAIRRRGRTFFPVVTPGPSRAAGESFQDFRSRLMGFYRDRIEDHFTGDPQSIALTGLWRELLRQAMEREEAVVVSGPPLQVPGQAEAPPSFRPPR